MTIRKYMGSNVNEWLGNFLLHEEFGNISGLQGGILRIIDIIRLYAEERVRLNPEILITKDLEGLLKPIPLVRKIVVGKLDAIDKSFLVALKRCAPLATDGWVIFLELKDGHISYGLISAESSELSISIRRQLVGEVAEGTKGPLAYIRALGSKAVEIKGTKEHLIISVSITEIATEFDMEIENLVKLLTRDIGDSASEKTQVYFRKTMEEAMNECHGCIVALVDDEEVAITQFKSAYPDGVYLLEPIDPAQYITDETLNKTVEAHTFLRTHCALIKHMIAFDGMTLFTTKGRLCGYNIFVPVAKRPDTVLGGSRTRAFSSLKESGLVRACLFRSEDGKTDFWECPNE